MTYERGRSAGYLTNWAARLFVRAIERRLTGGSAGPMPVFFALLSSETMSQKELANWASVEQPTMANTLNRMERDGLIERTPDPHDGRSALITLSRVGRQRAEQAMAAAAEVNGLALSGLTPAERELYFQLIYKVIGKLETDER
ncbi:MAG: MarR family transcriptional regulator [Hyphomicrobiales bacterium]|nr:MAG: MarR family transcriptional regulator [Hyphomicrobiales bacterium]